MLYKKTAKKSKYPKFLYERKHAFTLAEVLISLVIIGIIFSISIPIMINQYEKKQTVIKLQKVYSTLKQATNLAQYEYGEIETWDFSDTTKFMNTYYLPYINTAKVVENNYEANNYLFTWYDLKGKYHTHYNSTKHDESIMILGDGTYVLVAFSIEFDQNYNILVDINGSKKPNRLGRDVFAFSVFNNGLRTYSQYKNLTMGRAGALGAGTSGQCNKSAQGGIFGVGSYCSRVIELDNWTIKDDYPW